LAAWKRANRRGIVEAVTGSGKTYLALAAWQDTRQKHRSTYTLVVVPTVTLQEQWCDRIKTHFPDQRIARLGGGHQESFAQGAICVAVINSAVSVGHDAAEARILRLFEHCARCRENQSFLIADECHHYIHAPVFSRIRTLQRFDHVLALSATVGEDYEVEGLGRIIYEYTFADAIARGDVPPLVLLNTRCRLTNDEDRRYRDLGERIGIAIEGIKERFQEHLSEVVEDRFWDALKALDSEAGLDGDPEIRRLFGLVFQRTTIVYRSHHKLSSAKDIVLSLVNTRRAKIIVFFERIDTAEESQERLDVRTAQEMLGELSDRLSGWSGVIHSGLVASERRRLLDEFKNAGPSALFTCRLLDEGLDIPTIDAAVLVASTKSQRQRIQRIGRALRRGDGDKQPVVVTLYCELTTDQFVVARDRELFGNTTEILDLDPRGTLARISRHELRLR